MRPLDLSILFPLSRLFSRLSTNPFPPFHSLLHFLVVEALSSLRLGQSLVHQLPSLLILAFSFQHAAALMQQDVSLIIDTLLSLTIADNSPGFVVLIHTLTQILDDLPTEFTPKIEGFLNRVIDRLDELMRQEEKKDWTEEQNNRRFLEFGVLMLYLQKYLVLLDLTKSSRFSESPSPLLREKYPRLSRILVSLATSSTPRPPAVIPFFSLEPQCTKQFRRFAVIHRHYLDSSRGNTMQNITASLVQLYRESETVSLCGVSWEEMGLDLSVAGSVPFWREHKLCGGFSYLAGEKQPIQLIATQLLSYFAFYGVSSIHLEQEEGVSPSEELLNFHQNTVHRLKPLLHSRENLERLVREDLVQEFVRRCVLSLLKTSRVSEQQIILESLLKAVPSIPSHPSNPSNPSNSSISFNLSNLSNPLNPSNSSISSNLSNSSNSFNPSGSLRTSWLSIASHMQAKKFNVRLIPTILQLFTAVLQRFPGAANDLPLYFSAVIVYWKSNLDAILLFLRSCENFPGFDESYSVVLRQFLVLLHDHVYCDESERISVPVAGVSKPRFCST